jgi:hypothetical protein
MAITVNSMGLLSVQVPAQIVVEAGPAGGVTLRSLIFDHLINHAADLPGVLLDAQGQLRSGYAILVDGRNAMQLGGLDLFVQDGTVVLITALVSGG